MLDSDIRGTGSTLALGLHLPGKGEKKKTLDKLSDIRFISRVDEIRPPESSFPPGDNTASSEGGLTRPFCGQDDLR